MKLVNENTGAKGRCIKPKFNVSIQKQMPKVDSDSIRHKQMLDSDLAGFKSFSPGSSERELVI